MTINEAAAQSGFSADTLRYYERIGLIRPVPRKSDGRRDYGRRETEQLELIKQLKEMEEANRILESADVAIVIGANDVVNPAAAEDKGSPIYGMPIIEAYKAKTVLALKRGKGAGFSGLENGLFFRPNTRMIYGDAKATINELVAKFKEK